MMSTKDIIDTLPLESEGFDINAEIIFKLIQRDARIKEIPVILTKRTLGYSKLHTIREIKNHLKMFYKILLWKRARSSARTTH